MRKKLAIFLGVVLLFVVLINIPESKDELKTQHFTFNFSRTIDRSKISDLSDALESSYLRISNELQTTPAENIETNIYAQRWRYVKATKNWGASGNIEGISKLHFIDQAWSEDDVKKIAVHEFTHTVVLKLLIDQEPQPLPKSFDQKFATFPTWLWEGISVYEAGQFVDPQTLPYLSNTQYPNLSELNNRLKGGKIYTCGYTIVEYILSKYGRPKLIDLIKNYGDLKIVLGINEDQFCKDWHEFVKEKYLK